MRFVKLEHKPKENAPTVVCTGGSDGEMWPLILQWHTHTVHTCTKVQTDKTRIYDWRPLSACDEWRRWRGYNASFSLTLNWVTFSHTDTHMHSRRSRVEARSTSLSLISLWDGWDSETNTFSQQKYTSEVCEKIDHLMMKQNEISAIGRTQARRGSCLCLWWRCACGE